MKKTVTLITALTLFFCFVLGCVHVGAANGQQTDNNRYNVVFVTDASASMNDTDPDGYRFEAIELFTSLLADGGNKAGSVVFSDGVVSKHDIIDINGKKDKSSIVTQIRKQPAVGWTDIGSGLSTALNMLDANGNKSIPSVIILLTDGNTEMKTDELTKESIAKKEEAMELARKKGVKIYTISLNKDKSANSSELKQIAQATGGQFKEVTSVSDLQSVFDLYYQMIYSTKSLKLADEKVPASGVIVKEFSVADMGVEEVNIVTFGNVKSSTLTKPDKTNYTAAEMEQMTYKTNTFSLSKISDPQKGKWKLTVKATPNSVIKIFKIYNPNMQVDAKIVNEKDSYSQGYEIKFNAKVMENGKVIDDISRYQGYTANLTVKDYNGETVKEATAAQATNNGFELSFVPDEYGTYYAEISIENGELFATSDKFTINVGNTAPVATSEVIKKHINRWPFLIKTDSTIDLSQAAKDNEDATLQYKVRSSSWLDEDYTLDGDKLTIDNFSVSKGSFTVDAYDTKGAYCTFDVEVTSTNIGFWTLVGLIAIIVIVVALILFFAYKDRIKTFMGEFRIENIETGEVVTTSKGRGRLYLKNIAIGQTGLDRNCYFQATGKNFVKFISKKPVYSDYTVGKTKKITINSSMDIRISSTDFNKPSEDGSTQKGIIVRFESLLNNKF